MESVNIKGKDVYIFEHHHHALKAWSITSKCNLFTLDYHSDTLSAFCSYAFEKASEKYDESDKRFKTERLRIVSELIHDYRIGKIDINKIIELLKYNEHIVFAVKAKIVNSVFIFCTHQGKSNYSSNRQDKNIVDYSPPCLQTCTKKRHNEECIKLRTDLVIDDTYLGIGMDILNIHNHEFFNRYILDIDLDYFNTEKSLSPKNNLKFYNIIKKAEIITISKESSCVLTCRRKKESINSDSILEKIMIHINNAL